MARLIPVVLLLVVLCCIVALACEFKEIDVSQGSLSHHECDDDEWHFAITQVDGDQWPGFVDVSWEGDYTQTPPLAWTSGHVAHYTTTEHLDLRVVTATATIYAEWDGTFVLSHGPCLPPTAVTDECLGVEQRGADAVLRWRTETEIDCLFFDVTRDGEPLATVLCQTPGSPQGNDYEYVDRPGPGTWAYAVAGVCLTEVVTIPHVLYLPLMFRNGQEPTVLDYQENIRDWDWLRSVFGDVNYVRGSSGPHLIQVQESPPDSPAVLDVRVVDAEGNPVQSATVVRSWPGAPLLPESLRRCGLDVGVYGGTDTDGWIGFGLGWGDYYWPPAGGASTVWVVEDGKDTDCLSGLGMLAGTNHVHIRPSFEVGN